MINLFIASGNLGRDMEIFFTANGKCIGTFSLPVKSGWGDNEKTSWVRCKLLGDRAEKLSPFLLKGLKVTVTGRFELEEWEKDGVKHSIPCIIVDNVDLPAKNDNHTAAPAPTPQQPVAQPKLSQKQLDEFSDNIPF